MKLSKKLSICSVALVTILSLGASATSVSAKHIHHHIRTHRMAHLHHHMRHHHRRHHVSGKHLHITRHNLNSPKWLHRNCLKVYHTYIHSGLFKRGYFDALHSKVYATPKKVFHKNLAHEKLYKVGYLIGTDLLPNYQGFGEQAPKHSTVEDFGQALHIYRSHLDK